MTVSRVSTGTIPFTCFPVKQKMGKQCHHISSKYYGKMYKVLLFRHILQGVSEESMKRLFKGLGASIGYIAIYLVVSFLILFTGGLVYAILERIPYAQTGSPVLDYILNNEADFQMLSTFVAGLIALFIYWLIIKIRKKTVRETLDLNPVPLRSLLPVIPLGIFINILISHLLDLLPIPEEALQEYADASGILASYTFPVFLASVIMAPVIEEVLFRGLVFNSLKKGMPVALAIVLQALFFGVLHGQILWICYATVFGIIFGIFKNRYGSLYPTILLHLSVNGWNFIWVYIGKFITYTEYTSLVISVVSFAAVVIFSVIIFKSTARTKDPVCDGYIGNALPVEDSEIRAVVGGKQ